MGTAMDRLALTGFALAAAGAIGLLAAELVGTAHAGRPGDTAYLVAVSSGSTLRLVPRSQRTLLESGAATLVNNAHAAAAGERASHSRLACARVVDVSAVSLGFRCHGG